MTSIPSLTGIRGAAALWVVTYHLQSLAPSFGLPQFYHCPLLQDGRVGVDIFFMLSGFILMYTHEADFRTIRAKRLFEFAWLRFFRIYPLATAVLLLIVGIVAFDPGFAVWYRHISSPESLTLVPFIKTLFLATRWIPPFSGDWNQPVWSLSVEIIGYCAFPWLATACTRLPHPTLPLAIGIAAIAAPMAMLAQLPGIPPEDIGTWASVRMGGCFIGGVALCRAWRLLPQLDVRIVRTGAIAAVVAIVAIGLLPIGGQWIDLPSAGLIFCLAYREGIVDRALSSRVAMFFGHVSFPLYLLHVMALRWLSYFLFSHSLGWPLSAMMLATAIVALMAVSYGLHRLIERPTHRWAREWLKSRQRHADLIEPERANEAAQPS